MASPLASRHVLVTGGMGYIGSHTTVLLVAAGYQVTIIDNLSNSNEECLRRVNKITGKPEAVTFVNADLRDRDALKRIFASAPFEGVIHFAAFKAVGESRAKPLLYYDNNLCGTIALLDAMQNAGCKSLVFSSSCTVYGSASPSPLDEKSPTGVTTNAYAATKAITESILFDLHNSDPSWKICVLRYFNPVGAHPSGTIGEDPRGIPNCLMPFVLQVLVGRLPVLTVHGGDYETRDGTAVRDYIHVVDVARGHLDALAWMAREGAARAAASAEAVTSPSGGAAAPLGFIDVFNFGTGQGSTVLELIAAMEAASGKKVPFVMGPRRHGDVAAAYANPAKAERVLGWKPQYSITDSCRDAWLWQSTNPEGFAAPPPA